MTHAYTDGLHDAALSLTWCAGVLTVLLAVAAIALTLWYLARPVTDTVLDYTDRARLRRAERASGRIPGI